MAFVALSLLASPAWAAQAPITHDLAMASPALAATNNYNIQVNHLFTPLHTYYMSPSGSDTNSGASASSPWLTPNHSQLVCGDLIVAAAGSYAGQAITTTPTGCPSPPGAGGIDGNGGIYAVVLLCGGASVGDCYTTGNAGASGGGPNASFQVTANYWAIEGWRASPGTGGGNISFAVNACDIGLANSGTKQTHHVAFINDISYNSDQGFTPDECAENHNVPGNGGDYIAVVGSIAENSNTYSYCVAAIDIVAPSAVDSVAGTHIFIDGNFVWNNATSSGCSSDEEGMMFDTWDAHGYSQQGVISNNMVWTNYRFGLNIFQQSFNPATPTIKVYNNTFYHNNVGSSAAGDLGDINIQDNSGYNTIVTNNVSRTFQANSPGGGGSIYALLVGNGVNGHLVIIGGSGTQNIFKGLATSCDGSSCDSSDNVVAFNGQSYGTNTYVDPAFTNATDLISNRNGAPNCSGFTNVTACMGYDATTGTLTTPSVISDLTPTASGMTGKGYQRPSMTCAPNADFPTWLKGLVYLHWTGTQVEQLPGLVSVPCGM